jgi:hypothetical protein
MRSVIDDQSMGTETGDDRTRGIGEGDRHAAVSARLLGVDVIGHIRRFHGDPS